MSKLKATMLAKEPLPFATTSVHSAATLYATTIGAMN